MYNIIPLIIILVCLAVIVFVILRRMSHLTSSHTLTTGEIVQKAKTRILDMRLKRKFSALGSKLKPFFGGMKKKMSSGLDKTKVKLESMRKEIEIEELPKEILTQDDFEKKQEFIEEQLQEAQELAIEENFEDAEKRFIDVISHDEKNSDAYFGLAELYAENKKYTEAIETFKYLHKLLPESAKVLIELAEVYEQTGKSDQSLDAIKQAQLLEPRNPKILDMITNIYIKRGDKIGAQESLDILTEVNPENGKLEDLQNMIDGL
jgi:tetratricopeptide (TPR) repeat protein